MRIQAIDTATNEGLADTRIQLVVKGQSGGLLTFTTDSKGYFDLDDKYKGQQIAFSSKGVTGDFVTASDAALLKVSLKEPVQ